MPVAPMGNLGPCFVIWDPYGAARVDLNPTLGGVKARDALQHRDIFTDQHGDTPVDGVDMGRITEIEVTMTESSLHQLLYVIQGSSMVGGSTKLTVKNSVGNAMLANAKQIIIKPSLNNAASGITTQWLTFNYCFPVVDQEIIYSKDDQRITKVLFKVFPSEVTATLKEMYHYGV